MMTCVLTLVPVNLLRQNLSTAQKTKSPSKQQKKQDSLVAPSETINSTPSPIESSPSPASSIPVNVKPKGKGRKRPRRQVSLVQKVKQPLLSPESIPLPISIPRQPKRLQRYYKQAAVAFLKESQSPTPK